MNVEIQPTEKPEKLLEYLKPRLKEIEKTGEKLEAETEEPEKLARTPGIENFKVNGEKQEGLGGTPIHRKAFYKIENREDAAKAFLATVDGYTLIISTDRQWDLRKLKKYNSEIIETSREAAEKLGVEKLDEDFEDVTREELLAIYDEFLME